MCSLERHLNFSPRPSTGPRGVQRSLSWLRFGSAYRYGRGKILILLPPQITHGSTRNDPIAGRIASSRSVNYRHSGKDWSRSRYRLGASARAGSRKGGEANGSEKGQRHRLCLAALGRPLGRARRVGLVSSRQKNDRRKTLAKTTEAIMYMRAMCT